MLPERFSKSLLKTGMLSFPSGGLVRGDSLEGAQYQPASLAWAVGASPLSSAEGTCRLELTMQSLLDYKRG